MTGETGSYMYMAPEVFNHEQYSLSVDVYAWAMIAYQAFEQQPPFPGKRPMEAAQAALAGKRPPPPARVPSLLSNLVVAAWSADASQRPTFTTIVEVLSRFALHNQIDVISSSAARLGAKQTPAPEDKAAAGNKTKEARRSSFAARVSQASSDERNAHANRTNSPPTKPSGSAACVLM